MAGPSAEILTAANLTSTFNDLLRERNAPPTRQPVTLDAIDGFLKEAYRINSHITTLHKELKDVRQAYLSTAQPRKGRGRNGPGQTQSLTNQEREEVDANAKQMIRELNASIRGLQDAEELRRETESAVIRKKYTGGLASLGAWASGGGTKSAEHAAAEAQLQQTAMHRDGVLWFLQQRLQTCGRTQHDMMETRLTREVEKSRASLAPTAGDFAEFPPTAPTAAARSWTSSARGDDTTYQHQDSQELTDEQVQMFEKGNQDMMKHYESAMDKVRTAEKSLLEISELQSMLVSNLSTQSAHIEQLVADSFSTTENVGGGNKQLQRAAERPSAARYTFMAASGLCAFLVLWDLFI